MRKIAIIALLLSGVVMTAEPSFADASQAISEISTPGYIWQTGSSFAAKKQFWNGEVFNYSGGVTDPEVYTLIDVTHLTNILEYPGEGIKYIYYINNGTKYYMYENDNDFLECHWDPDGYSGSDSLVRISDNVTENTELINLQTYDGSVRTFELSSISVFTGYDAAGETETCLAANLKKPIQLRRGYSDVIIHSIQIFGDAVNQFCESRNIDMNFENYDRFILENSENLFISGTLIEAHTAHHHTPVIMQVMEIW